MKFWFGALVFVTGLLLAGCGLYMLHPGALVLACGLALASIGNAICSDAL